MAFKVVLPSYEVTGTRVDCNCEAAFTPEINRKIQEAIALMALPAKKNAPVKTDAPAPASDWVPVSQSAEAPPAVDDPPADTELATPAAKGVIAEKPMRKDYQTQFRDGLRSLRSLVKDRDERATIYKILFAVAMQSERELPETTGAIASVRELFDMDDLACSVVSDATAKALPNSPYKTKEISVGDKQAIMALILMALNADDQKHVLEIAACKMAMVSLEITSLDNKVIGKLTGKPAKEIVVNLSGNAQAAAYLCCMRMVLADGVLRDAERDLLRAFSSTVPAEARKLIYKVATLERGKVFEL